MSKISKGNRIERLARDILRDQGWLVERKPRVRFSSPDFFGLFDLFALKGGQVRLIQIKSNASHFYTARKEIEKFVSEQKLDYNKVSYEVWLYEGRSIWRCEKYLSEWLSIKL